MRSGLFAVSVDILLPIFAPEAHNSRALMGPFVPYRDYPVDAMAHHSNPSHLVTESLLY